MEPHFFKFSFSFFIKCFFLDKNRTGAGCFREQDGGGGVGGISGIWRGFQVVGGVSGSWRHFRQLEAFQVVEGMPGSWRGFRQLRHFRQLKAFQVVGGISGSWRRFRQFEGSWRHFRQLKGIQVVGGISGNVGGMQDVTKVTIALLRKFDKSLN